MEGPLASQRASQVLAAKSPPASAGDVKDVGPGRSPGGRHGNPLQYSCLENPVDRGAWGGLWGHRGGHDSSDLAAVFGGIF